MGHDLGPAFRGLAEAIEIPLSADGFIIESLSAYRSS
jgi:hypothetical protein